MHFHGGHDDHEYVINFNGMIGGDINRNIFSNPLISQNLRCIVDKFSTLVNLEWPDLSWIHPVF